jgi:hypothetical protein
LRGIRRSLGYGRGDEQCEAQQVLQRRSPPERIAILLCNWSMDNRRTDAHRGEQRDVTGAAPANVARSQSKTAA